MDDKDKVNIEHPIVHLEEKVQYLRFLKGTLTGSVEKFSNSKVNPVTKTDEQISQYEKAIEILREYHG